MITFWNVFGASLAIVIAASLFLLLWTLIGSIPDYLRWKADVAAYELEQSRKWPPFQKAVLKKCPNLTMVTVDLYKENEVVASMGADLPHWLHRSRVVTRFDV